MDCRSAKSDVEDTKATSPSRGLLNPGPGSGPLTHFFGSLLGRLREKAIGDVEGVAPAGGEAADEHGKKRERKDQEGDHDHEDTREGGNGSKPAKVGNAKRGRTRPSGERDGEHFANLVVKPVGESLP